MNLMRYEPWNALHLIHRDMNRLAGYAASPIREDDGLAVTRSKQWSPAVDVYEEPDRFVIKADLPGIDPKSVTVTAERSVLTISAERAPDE